ncbi:NAD(+) synthase [Candidatus Parcubacteria bacterium]|nr:NAD(+) synthase [Candidatus Parcubacteria bacterium]
MSKFQKIKLPKINPSEVYRQIGDFIVGQVLSFEKTGCVIGLSGGVDSTLAAAIAKKRFDEHNLKREKKIKLELVGYMIPSDVNNSADLKDATLVAEKLGIRYEVCDIKGIVDAYRKTNSEAMENKFHKGNLTSEMRAVVLHGKAATEKKILIGTGNKDEDFGIGYYTLFGDGAVHISPNAGLSKRLVREMVSWLGFAEIANRIPSAGLELGQTDFGDLGYKYNMVELVTEALQQGFDLHSLANLPQINKTAKDQMFLYGEIFGFLKFDSPVKMINDILKRHEMAKKKAMLLNPAIANITLHYD